MTDHSYNTRTTEAGDIVAEPPYADYLRGQGYIIDGVSDVQFIDSDSRDMQHMICRVETHELPWGHDDLDVSADGVSLPVCSCEDYTYTQSVDVADHTLAQRSPGLCRHLLAEFKTERAQADDQQETFNP